MQFPPPLLKEGRHLVTTKNKAAGLDSHNTASLIEKTNDIFHFKHMNNTTHFSPNCSQWCYSR